MGKKAKIFTTPHCVSAIFMIFVLLWFTISTPFVFARQFVPEHKAADLNGPIQGNDEDTGNPYGNTNEEKTPSGTSLSEEYIHDHHPHTHFFTEVSLHFDMGHDGDYIAFYGELLVPPPNFS